MIARRTMPAGQSEPLERSHSAARAACRRRPCRRGGQILIILILAMTLLVGLAFYVYNLGQQINDRLSLQNTADSVAVAAGAWMARCMNVVAMDNVAQAKLLALVPVIDSFPLASKMAYEEVTAWEQGMAAQIGRGVPNTSGEGPPLMMGLEALRARIAAQRDILAPYAEVMNEGDDVERVTHWAFRGGGAPPNGKLWQAAMALDELSQATVASCGLLAQADAVRFGQANDAQTSLVVPVLPYMPARRGNHLDFGPPLVGRLSVRADSAIYAPSGGRGGAIGDYAFHHRLGPWARLLKWRDSDYRREGGSRGEYVQTVRTRGGSTPHLGGTGFGSSVRQRNSGYWVGGTSGTSILIGYTAYGPYTWALRRVHAATINTRQNPGSLPDTDFYRYVGKLSDAKLKYMLRPQGTDAAIRTIEYPQWTMDYDQARKLAAQPNVRVRQTMIYVVEVASRFAEGAPGWLSPGSYRGNFPPPSGSDHQPISRRVSGWVDPEDWKFTKVWDHIWKNTYTYETTSDPAIGLVAAKDPITGQPIWHTVYVVSWYIFGGIDTGGEIEIRNPANWDEHDVLPAPVMLDTSLGDYDPVALDADAGVRRELFTLLGLAQGPTDARAWPQRFVNPNPSGGSVAMSQVEVFNNTSWDLWTQDWRVQLVPVTQYGDWMQRMGRDVPNAALTQGMVDEARMRAIYEYLSSIEPQVADMFLKH